MVLNNTKNDDIIMSNDLAAELFLSSIKKLIREKKVVIAKREKNRNFMLEYGLNSEDLFEIINGLTAKNRHSPVEKDNDGSDGNVMVFFALYQDFEIYIKLKIIYSADKKSGVVISFHKEGEYE